MRTYGQLENLPAGHPDNKWRRPMWRITAEPNVSVRLKRIFPRVQAQRSGAILIADTPEIGRDLDWVLERWPMTVPKDERQHLDAQVSQHRQTEENVTLILGGQRLEGMPEPAVKPREYQLQAADLVLATGRLLLTDVVGLGKTFSSLLVLRDPRALPALVVTLTHLPQQWLEELNKTLPWLNGHIINSTRVYDPSTRRGSGGKVPDVLICSYSKLAGWSDHLAGTVKTVIFDEIQELRHPGTLRFESAGQVADAATYKMGLSATPVYNYGGEIHNVFSILAPDALGTRAEFVREWGSEDSNANVRVKDPKALGAFLRDEGLMVRRTRPDVGRELPHLPQRIPHTIDADQGVFESLTGNAADLARLIVSPTASSSMKFSAKGRFDDMMRQATGVAKAPYVADFVRMIVESGEKVVLFGWHHAVYDIWRDRLADLAPHFYTGAESRNRKEAAKAAFIDGDCQVLCMSLRAGAGLNGLQDVCSVAVFGELDWSPAMHDQCIGRLDRDGQESPVIAYFLTANVGYDGKMLSVLGVKRQQANPIQAPELPLVEKAPDATKHLESLAADFLATRTEEPIAA